MTRGVVVITTTQLHSGSAEVRILLIACRRFSMVRVSDNGPSCKYDKTPFIGKPYRKNNSSSSLLFKKTTNFTGKQLQNYK